MDTLFWKSLCQEKKSVIWLVEITSLLPQLSLRTERKGAFSRSILNGMWKREVINIVDCTERLCFGLFENYSLDEKIVS